MHSPVISAYAKILTKLHKCSYLSLLTRSVQMDNISQLLLVISAAETLARFLDFFKKSFFNDMLCNNDNRFFSTSWTHI